MTQKKEIGNKFEFVTIAGGACAPAAGWLYAADAFDEQQAGEGGAAGGEGGESRKDQSLIPNR
jgi:hypothetical protein